MRNDGEIRASIIDSLGWKKKKGPKHGRWPRLVRVVWRSKPSGCFIFNKGLPFSRLGTETLQRVASLSTRGNPKGGKYHKKPKRTLTNLISADAYLY
jgi:hypothetical protein